MNTALWIVQGLLAAMFAMAGFGKISASKEKHIADRHIRPHASVVPIRLLGVMEGLGCIGIIVPWLTGIFPVLTPVAATGFGWVLIAGMVVHVRRKEYKMLWMLSVLLSMAVFVAVFRFRELFQFIFCITKEGGIH